VSGSKQRSDYQEQKYSNLHWQATAVYRHQKLIFYAPGRSRISITPMNFVTRWFRRQFSDPQVVI